MLLCVLLDWEMLKIGKENKTFNWHLEDFLAWHDVLSGKQTYLWPLTLYPANVAAILGYQNSLFPRDPWVLDSTNK